MQHLKAASSYCTIDSFIYFLNCISNLGSQEASLHPGQVISQLHYRHYIMQYCYMDSMDYIDFFLSSLWSTVLTVKQQIATMNHQSFQLCGQLI